jgi:hypothetical protein
MVSDRNLLDTLSSFHASERLQAVHELLAQHPERPPEKPWVNMHLHSFFSYNGENWSPTRLAWEARQTGLYAMGICDFDVLTGMNELYAATDLLEVRATAGFESRTFFAEYADSEINSPGEPGVFYFMGTGFAAEPPPESPAGQTLAAMLEQSHERNRATIERINGKLNGLTLDYDADVLPLTPAGNATERHIIRSYFDQALAQCGSPDDAAQFWAENLHSDADSLRQKITDANAFCDLLRSKLMKKGGLGYEQPTSRTFPQLDDVIAMILAADAIPTSTWLDGTSDGEADPATQLECLMNKGVAAVNIIPDRNWNIKDDAEKARKIQELHRYAETAMALHLPILVGTELNKPGQRFVDDFTAPALQPLLPAFLEGARILVGHTRLLRYAGYSYIGKAAAADFPERARRNQLFAAVGALPPPSAALRRKLAEMLSPTALAYIIDCAHKGGWK